MQEIKLHFFIYFNTYKYIKKIKDAIKCTSLIKSIYAFFIFILFVIPMLVPVILPHNIEKENVGSSII